MINESEMIKEKIAVDYQTDYFDNRDLADNVCELFDKKLEQIKPQFQHLFLSHFRDHFENLMDKKLSDKDVKTLICLHLFSKKLVNLLD